jgi:diaminopimelate epimerase
MCGNGGRCMTAFAKSLGLIDLYAHFWAVDGMHEAEIAEQPEPVYKLKMKDTCVDKIYDDGFFLDTGSPHFVTFREEDVAAADIFNKGRALRHDQRFAPGGTNVDFVELKDQKLFVRTFERGVENETLSCGTGVTASALACAYLNPVNQGFYKVQTPGGTLKVSFVQTGMEFTDIWLEGPARFVFRGEVEVAK